MVRLRLFAEGPTEQTFADAVLKRHLAGFGVYLHPPVLIAHAKKKGKVHRGGGRRYLAMKNDIARFLAQEKGGDVFFTTMIDLYAIPSDFPGLADAEKLRHLPDKRVEFLEGAFGNDIGDRRFIPYIQLHEYEAYLFSDPTWFGFFYDHHEKQIAALKAIAAAVATPELIDDGQHSAPSKRIIAQLPDYADAKPVVGPQVAELTGLAVIRAKCPHFSAWVSRLETLQSTKMEDPSP
ncbi:MAG: DUF4276 family protein [Planctomycetes bacterium]|nr:DUF4276 family protein [Planctomycetota bacterium]